MIRWPALILCFTLCSYGGLLRAEAGAEAGGTGGAGGSGVTIPPRRADAMGGRAFMQGIAELSPSKRETAIQDELLNGNVPDFLRRFVTIHTMTSVGDDLEVTATYEVAPDYLAIGSDEDFVRVPMTPMTAQAVADAFDCVLPTRKMVNDIYDQAQIKLAPWPMTEAREAVATFIQHHDMIEQQRQGKPLGELVSGIKKDIVVTNRLQEKPHRVAIYGWHKLDGELIQPLSIVHVNTYVDYSHGVRLIRRTMRAEGKPTTVDALLGDPVLAGLVSDEGPITPPRY